MPAEWTTTRMRATRSWKWRWGRAERRKDGKTEGDGPRLARGPFFRSVVPSFRLSVYLSAVHRIKQKLVRPMRLAPEGDLRGEQVKRSFAHRRLGPRDAAVEILLAPRPAAPERGPVGEPRHLADPLRRGVGTEPHHRALVEHDDRLPAHALRGDGAGIDRHFEERGGDVELLARKRPGLPVGAGLHQLALHREAEVASQRDRVANGYD